MSDHDRKDAASSVPNDGYSYSSAGSNYGMDGFFHDMEYNKGVEEPELTPDSPLESQNHNSYGDLPEGMVVGDYDEHDVEGLSHLADAALSGDSMEEFFKEGALSNLDWLESGHIDEERLPSHSSYEALPQLEEAWGTLTDGVSRWQSDMAFVPNEDAKDRSIDPKLAQYENETWEARKADLVRAAQRRLDAGETIREVFEYVKMASGESFPEFREDLRRIASEHGLAGNVYVYASSYPRLATSDVWKKIFRRRLQARYIVADDPTVEVGDTLYGKEIVASVPWDEAYAHYVPYLRATGRRVASGSDPKEALRTAFLSKPVKEVKATEFPTHVTPSERITLQTAAKEVQAAEAKVEKFSASKRTAERLEKQVNAKVAKYVAASQISADQAEQARQAADTVQDFVKRIADFIILNQNKTGTYEGDGQNASYRYDPGYDHNWDRIQQAAQSRVSRKERFVMAKLRNWMTEGFAGDTLDELVNASFAPDVRELHVDLIRTARAQHEGLSGFLYVDADAYATKTGTAGCDEGARKHRANDVKFVLAMDRCGSCTFANADGVCSKYNKPLVSDLPKGNVKAYQKEMIRLANAPDPVQTASLFADAYDPDEFGLSNENLEQFEYESRIADSIAASVDFGDGMILDWGDE